MVVITISISTPMNHLPSFVVFYTSRKMSIVDDSFLPKEIVNSSKVGPFSSYFASIIVPPASWFCISWEKKPKIEIKVIF